jgi:hypothetical protein
MAPLLLRSRRELPSPLSQPPKRLVPAVLLLLHLLPLPLQQPPPPLQPPDLLLVTLRSLTRTRRNTTLPEPSRAFTALSLLRSACAAEARSSKTLDLLRHSNREAYLTQCVGAVSPTPCKSCSKGLGPWKQCCVAAGFLRGSCANCHYGGEGKRCSLRPGKLIQFPSTFLIYI